MFLEGITVFNFLLKYLEIFFIEPIQYDARKYKYYNSKTSLTKCVIILGGIFALIVTGIRSTLFTNVTSDQKVFILFFVIAFSFAIVICLPILVRVDTFVSLLNKMISFEKDKRWKLLGKLFSFHNGGLPPSVCSAN